MIEFNGLKIDTRSLVLIAVTIIAVVALWPDGAPQTDEDSTSKDEKPSMQRYSAREKPASQGRTAQAERPAPWQNQFNPYQPQPLAGRGSYPPGTHSPQGSGAYSQSPPYGNQHYRPPYETERPATRNPSPYGYGTQSSSPYGYNPYPGLRFRPKEQPKPQQYPRSGSGVPPTDHYSPVSPANSTTPAYSPAEPMPWEYSPYDVSPYDVAPSGSTAELNHLYTVR